jgi:hypothetical protein
VVAEPTEEGEAQPAQVTNKTKMNKKKKINFNLL